MGVCIHATLIISSLCVLLSEVTQCYNYLMRMSFFTKKRSFMFNDVRTTY